MTEGVWQKRAAILLSCFLLFLLAFAVFSYVRGPLFAGIFSFITATAVQSPSRKLSRLTGISKRICSAFLVLLMFALFGIGLGVGVARLWQELRQALVWLSQNREQIMEELGQRVGVLMGHKEGLAVSDRLSEWLLSALGDAGTVLGSWFGGVLRATPRAVMLLGIAFLSCLYLSMDYDKIGNAVLALLPRHHRSRAIAWRRRVISTVADYGRAYLLLMMITFLETLVGMMILGQPMGLLIACLVAIVDILPILGAGTVLIPWGILSLAGGRIGFGIGILVLYGVITVVRQLAEPHLVGGSLGLHPLAALAATFLGFWLLGGFGVLIAPLVAVLIREFLSYHIRKKEGNQEKV